MANINDNCESAGYQVNVVNIKYGNLLTNRKIFRPTDATLDVPDAILKLKTKGDESGFRDAVETFAYNTLTRKFGAEVTGCQVWLPIEND